MMYQEAQYFIARLRARVFSLLRLQDRVIPFFGFNLKVWDYHGFIGIIWIK